MLEIFAKDEFSGLKIRSGKEDMIQRTLDPSIKRKSVYF